MRLKNTSRYPEAEVRALVEFGMKGVNTRGLAVNVKNSRHAYRGMAYYRVPSCSPASKLKTVERLVTIGIGAPEQFPADNLRTVWKRGPLLPREHRSPESYDPKTWKVWIGRKAGVDYIQYGEPIRQPYGGKRSPEMHYADWKEALVALAAHEGRHIYQMQHKKPLSEVDCEHFAARRLEEWRRAQAEREAQAGGLWG